MRIFDIIPLKSAGDVKLGLTKGEILSKIGHPTDSLPERDCYQYDTIFFSISYDQTESVEYIEYSAPTDTTTKVQIKGIDIFGTPAEDLIHQITTQTGCEYDKEDVEIPYSYLFPDLELSLWRSVVPDTTDDMEGKYFMTVGIGTKGYYTDK